MYAVVAFLGRVLARIDVERVVGAGLHARLAADAAVGVEVDDAVFALEEGGRRADVNAGCVTAVVAAHHGEEPLGLRPSPLLDVLDPGPVHAERDVVLGLAGDRAGVTADAGVLIYDEPVPQAPSLRGLPVTL